MELIDSKTEWSCYKPVEEYSRGHLVFHFADPNNLDHRKITVDTARRYGKAMVDTGFARDYYMYTYFDYVHVALRYDDDEKISMYGFMNFIKEKCQKLK